MNNHCETSERETFKIKHIIMFLFSSFTTEVFQHAFNLFAQIQVSALRSKDSYKKMCRETFLYLSLHNITLNWSNKTKKSMMNSIGLRFSG